MQAKLNQVVQLSRELVFDYGVKQRDIYKAITKHLKASSTRNEYVLYNDCYGGFSYSSQFCKYADISAYNIERTGKRDKIRSFGNMLSDKYPRISRLLCSYIKHNIEDEVEKCLDYNSLKKYTQMMKKNMEHLLKLRSDMHIHTTDVLDALVYSSMYRVIKVEEDINGEYTVQHLIDALQKHMHDSTIKMEDMHPSLNMAILDTLSPEHDREHRTGKSFLDAVEELGESDSRIWDYQSHACVTSMKCLQSMDEGAFSHVEADDEVFELLGLMGASGTHTCLKLAVVPAELSWSISEYDGQESVYVA